MEDKNAASIGKGRRGTVASSYSSPIFQGQFLREHSKHHDVLDYYKVLCPRYKKGSTSDIFIVRRRRWKRTKIGRWISLLKVDGSTISLSTAALHAPPFSFNAFDGKDYGIDDQQQQQQVYAIKTLRKDRVGNLVYLNALKNELRLLKHLDHPNIVRIYEAFEERKEVHLVLEYCSGGDLYQRAPYTEQDAAKIVKQILSAVHYLHQNHIVHRDLKFENILFESGHPDAEIKLIDFGLSTHLANRQDHRTAKGGTAYVMAPEALQGNYSLKSDLWSVGVIAFMLLLGQKPFHGETREHLVRNIRDFNLNVFPDIWTTVSSDAKEFVLSLLNVEPMKRLTASQALASTWIVNSNVNHLSENKLLDTKFIARVKDCLEKFSVATSIKKLGLIYIAHRSSTRKVCQLKQLYSNLFENQSRSIMANLGYSKETFHKIFSSDGVTGYTMFIAATLEMCGLVTCSDLHDAFEWLDMDKSGTISKKDLYLHFGSSYSEDVFNNQSKHYEIEFKEFVTLFRDEASDSTTASTQRELEADFDDVY